MESLEMLVKLASFGAAGVCILAIFIVGKYILALPKDSPSWKVDLMKRYQKMCIIIAVISFLAGAVNAYFNQGKIATANQNAEQAKQETAVVVEQYREEQLKTEAFKAEVSNQLLQLQSQVTANPEVSRQLNNLQLKAREFRIKPVDEVVNELPVNEKVRRR